MKNIVGAILIVMMIQADACVQPSKRATQWNSLSPIPDSIGFAGSFAGVSNGALLVAGGANFPDGGAPWTGSLKKWSNKIFLLDAPTGKWRLSGSLPDSLGYGGSVSYKDELILIGGSNENGHNTAVIAIQNNDTGVSNRRLPDLPKPMANSTAVLSGHHIYVAGGISKPDATEAEADFWRLDLEDNAKGWEVLDSWPGSPRMLAVLGEHAGKIYLLSGVALINGQRKYLEDAFRFDPVSGWSQIANLPVSVAAAASPALSMQDGLIIVGGDDGELAPQASELKEKHPGFSNRMLHYNVASNSWSNEGEVHLAGTSIPVTTTAVQWNNLYVLPGGEVRPAVRTNVVLALKTNEQ